MKLEDIAKQAALEAAVARCMHRGRQNPVRSARNLAELAAVLKHAAPPAKDSPFLQQLAAAVETRDEDGALILLKAEFW